MALTKSNLNKQQPQRLKKLNNSGVAIALQSPKGYIDLFAGAGGLSEGFFRAGFKPIAHVEMEENACLTLKTRIAYYHLEQENNGLIYDSYLKGQIDRETLYKSIPESLFDTVINSTISADTINDIFHRIDSLLPQKTIDLIIGGPPCQAYSVIGRSRDPERMKNDPRNYLFKHYIEFLNRYKPKIFVFENVKGLLSAGGKEKFLKMMMEGFENAGYEVDFKLLNASNFEVIQNRERIIIIGWRKELKLSYPIFPEKKANETIKNLFIDLPVLKPGQGEQFYPYSQSIKTDHYLYTSLIRNHRLFISQHKARPHNERDLKIYELAIKKWLDEQKRLKYNELPEELITHKNVEDFLDRFRVVDINGYSHTVVAHISKDGHYYIYPSLEQIRSITIREAARIQSFPDDYFFEGGQGAAFKQIGNAVPPLMAYRIAEGVKKMLEK